MCGVSWSRLTQHARKDSWRDVKKRWHEQHRTEEREAFDRMRLMESPQFARQEAEKLVDFIEA